VSHPIPSDHVQTAALSVDVPEEKLNEILSDIQSIAGENLASFLEGSLVHREKAVEVLNFKSNEEAILAVHPSTWAEHFSELDLADEEVRAVQDVYYNHSIDRAKNGHNNLNSDSVKKFQGQLLVVERPKGWGVARLVTAWQMMEFAREGLRPAEIIDYWVVENQEMPLAEWARDRNVGKEAVRKNIRQAKSKIQYKE